LRARHEARVLSSAGLVKRRISVSRIASYQILSAAQRFFPSADDEAT
jgi:hypothetical protein